MHYSLFVFRFYYKVIDASLKKIADCGPRAYPSLDRGYGPGLGLKRPGRAGPGRAGPGRAGPMPNINGLGWAWA